MKLLANAMKNVDVKACAVTHLINKVIKSRYVHVVDILAQLATAVPIKKTVQVVASAFSIGSRAQIAIAFVVEIPLEHSLLRTG